MGSSQSKKKLTVKEKERDVVDMLFSCSLYDILDDNLFYNHQNQAKEKIPTSFESIEEYLGSFKQPLLEETRAELSLKLEAISEASFAQVISLKNSPTHLCYDVTIDDQSQNVNNKSFQAFCGDVVLLIDRKPKALDDLQQAECVWSFGYVGETSAEQRSFRIRSSKELQSITDEFCKPLYVISIMSIAASERIWNALQQNGGDYELLQALLCTNSLVRKTCDHCRDKRNGIWAERIASTSYLNDAQYEAVVTCINSINCTHKSNVELIWGPPGTGKMRTVGMLLWGLLTLKHRTLTITSTDVSITKMASNVVNLTRVYANKCSFLFGTADILLFGDQGKLSNDVEDISLDSRVSKLIECLRPETGWKHSLTSMIKFLEQIVDIEEMKHLRDQFESFRLSLCGSLSILITQLPNSFIGDFNLRKMESLNDLVDSLGHLLFENEWSSEDISMLLNLRTEFLCVLQVLDSSLSVLDFPHNISRVGVEEFCVRIASLIFCSASSSHKLHSLSTGTIQVLVIDEASQLKECESIIPLQLPKIRHAVLISDPCQSQATTRSKVSKEICFSRSLFERLCIMGHSRCSLYLQYRMHPLISSFPNMTFYQNRMIDALNVRSKNYTKSYISGPLFGPYSFINISCGKVLDAANGKKNMIEVAVILRIMQLLHKACVSSGEKIIIGVVSPHTAQVKCIQQKLQEHYQTDDCFKVNVGSVDNFQNEEVDIMIISTVGSDELIEFSRSPHKINVALTRARHCLWILGNEQTLLKRGSFWATLINDAKARRCFFHADEAKDLVKVILEVKKDLDQLEDLLNAETTLFRNATWKVLFSDNFKRSFSNIESLESKNLVMLMLSKLSSGWRQKDSSTAAAITESRYSKIMKEFKVGGLHLICTIDLVKESKYTQALKVWDILPFHEISELVKRLDVIIALYTPENLSRCKEKCVWRGLEFPISWPLTPDFIQYKSHGEKIGASDGNSYVENVKVRESLLLMKFYSLSSGVVNKMITGCDGGDLGLPFELTEQEKEVVLFDKSSFILGRSGTGKTTVLTVKIFQKEQYYHLACEGFHDVTRKPYLSARQRNEVRESDEDVEVKRDVLHQLFVTFSPKLCYSVKQHVSELKRSICGGNSSTKSSSTSMEDIDHTTLCGDIADSFIDLPAEAYPLIITFHKFLLMLDGTVGTSYFERFAAVKHMCFDRASASRSVALQTFIRSKEVTYDIFTSTYWRQFGEKLTKNLDPSMVFSEIMSVIKCGLRVEEADGRLSRQQYVSLVDRNFTLDAQKRDSIYTIFLKYEKKKLASGTFDLADLVCDLHKRLKVEEFKGDEIDYVYIDEVQDLSMKQISLFKYVCKNVHEGFAFSGDTAQAIAKGISFRFEDIRALFFTEFLARSRIGIVNERNEKGKISRILHLSQNFRTHAQVLKLAQSVINLIYHFFPSSIDFLNPETSLLCGDPPVFMVTEGDEEPLEIIFGKIDGFGAEQVILVRDECSRKEVYDIVGKKALVLTIMECKGLEFEDVLLYDFFSSSPFTGEWRIVYEYINETDRLSSLFNPDKHTVLCSELKQLYVAITRTKQRLWICERMGFSHPMFSYWEKLFLVQPKCLDDSFVVQMQVGSGKDDWRSRGIKLFYENHYQMALMCFVKAGDMFWARLAEATDLRASSDRIHAQSIERTLLLKKAAEIFYSIGKAESAAECFFEIKEYQKAGDIYLKHCKEYSLEKAGECYHLGKCYELAAQVYHKAGNYSKFLSNCTDGKLFEMGFQYLDDWKQRNAVHMDGIVQDFLRKGAHHYFKIDDKSMMMKFVESFHSKDSMRVFLKKKKLFDELILLEKQWGNFLNAADIARMKPDPVLEADLLHMAGLHRESVIIILWYVFSQDFNHDERPREPFAQKKELLTRARSMAKSDSSDFYKRVCTVADILQEGETGERLLEKGLKFIYHYEDFVHMGLERVNTADEVEKMEQDLLDKSNELLLLKQVRGEFLGAVEFANRIGFTKLISKWRQYKEGRSFRTQFIASRRILDAYFRLHPEDIWPYTSVNDISLEGLVQVWNYWQGKVLELIHWCRGKICGSDLESCEVFCLNYFGLRKWRVSNAYVVQNTNAKWVEKIDSDLLQRQGNFVFIASQEFLSASARYWSRELLSVGMKMLACLESLHAYLIKSNASMFHQTSSLMYMFEVAKSLKIYEPKNRYDDPRNIRRYLQLSSNHICSNVFHVDWRKSLSKDMITLRRKGSFQILLKEALIQNIDLKRNLTFGQMGRVVMTILGSSKHTIDLPKGITGSFSESSPWKELVDNLSSKYRSFNDTSLILIYRDVVEETFSADWRRLDDYISPACFLYLLERLLILTSSSQGYVFTSRSCCFEWLIYEKWSPGFARIRFTSELDFKVKERIYNSLASIVHKLLLNPNDLKDWITKPNEDSYPVVVLRLFVLFCLVCVNSGEHFGTLYDLLDFSDIFSELPGGFYEALLNGRREICFVQALADALQEIENPLVIVSLGANISVWACQYAIALNIKMNEFNEDALSEALFADKPEKTSTGNGDLDKRYGLFWKIFETLEQLENKKGENLMNVMSTFPLMKVELDKMSDLLSSSTSGALRASSSQYSKCPGMESDSMLEELKELSSLPNICQPEMEAKVAMIVKLAKTLRQRREKLGKLLDSHLQMTPK